MFLAVTPPEEVLVDLETFLEPRVDADPDTFSAGVRNPEEWAPDTDPLVLQLWTHARDSLPAPPADFGAEHTEET